MSNSDEIDDDNFFQTPPTQLSIRKPLQPTNLNISHRRPPNKKPRLSPNPGKENVPPTPKSDFKSRNRVTSTDLYGDSSSTPVCSSLSYIPSSVDCSGPVWSLAAETEDEQQFSVDKEEGDDCFLKANREGYLCNSMEARLMKSRIQLKEKEDENDNEELDLLLKLCSEGNNDGECSSLGLGKDDSIQCPLCSIDIGDLSEEDRQVHTNKCLDNQIPLEQDSLRKCENSSSLIEESVDDPVQLPEQLANDLSPVLKWLRNLGLAKYEDVFIREEIDWDTLQSLTEEDLLSIGITPLGPRKKIVNALSELREAQIPQDFLCFFFIIIFL